MRKIVLIVLLAFLISGCGKKAAQEESVQEESVQEKGGETIKKGVPVVTVSILPQRYFIRRIVGDNFKVNVMIPPGHSPATYEPTPREIKAVSESILYFRIGHIGFENAWMEKLTSINKRMKVIDTSEGVSLITGMPAHSHAGEHDHQEKGHDCGEETGHDEDVHHHDGSEHHGGIDPHIWLSPTAVITQVDNMLKAFVAADPANRDHYAKNCRAFIREIKEMHLDNLEVLKGLEGSKFMVYHPAWSYFAREYGLIQFPIELEGKRPGAAGLKDIIDLAKKENIRVIFVQKQFDTSSADAVAGEINGRVITMDPLAPDWLENIKKIALTLKESL
ncbi:MAG: zinc ABC transporter solute-binding protein [bacterium]|nr:zinc ABC transporter solute-binding protein [bacterium]